MGRLKDAASDQLSVRDAFLQIGEALVVRASTALVDWDAVQAEFENGPPPLTDRERVEALVEFANGAPMPVAMLNRLAGLPLMKVRSASGRSPSLPLDCVREFVRAQLGALLSADETTKRRAVALAHEAQHGRVMRFPDGDRWRLVTRDLQSAVAHGLMLAMNASDLKQCAYAGCGRFFFFVGKGGRKTCVGTDCAKNVDRLKAKGRKPRKAKD